MSTKHLEYASVLHFDTAHYLDSLCVDIRRALWRDQTSTYTEGKPYKLPTQEDLEKLTHKLVMERYKHDTIRRALDLVFTDTYEVEKYILNRFALETTMINCPTDECIQLVCYDKVTGRDIGATSWQTGQPARDILEIHRIYADFIEFLTECYAECKLAPEELPSLWREWKTSQ